MGCEFTTPPTAADDDTLRWRAEALGRDLHYVPRSVDSIDPAALD